MYSYDRQAAKPTKLPKALEGFVKSTKLNVKSVVKDSAGFAVSFEPNMGNRYRFGRVWWQEVSSRPEVVWIGFEGDVLWMMLR